MILFIGGLVIGFVVGLVVAGRYTVGYWPWQGEDAAKRAGW